MVERNNSINKMLQILYIASEAEPLVKVGGLGDVAGSLPHALRALPPEILNGYSLDVRLVIPHHAVIREKLRKPRPLIFFSIPYNDSTVEALVSVTNINGVPVYLISGAPIPYNAPVYSGDPCLDGEKYVFFSLAALEMTRQLNWRPDIIQANDWHSATAIYKLAQLRNEDEDYFNNTKSAIIIHNLPYMGSGCEEALRNYNITPSTDSRLPEWSRHIPLPLGMQAADLIITVSPSYALEIQTPAYGNGLELFLKSRSDSIMGIVNGIDINDWNPATDPDISHNYGFENLELRKENKKILLEEFSLSPDLDIPLFIIITRMDHQKGVDLLIETLTKVVHLPWQAIILGTGNPELENACRNLEKEHPDKVRAVIRFDSKLSHRMYSAGDMILMPSRYEPCGLAQMIAMRYGCVPVARATGGLKDTIQDDAEMVYTTGFLFTETSSESASKTLIRAINTYAQPEVWKNIQIRGMQKDFSWKNSAIAYANAYLDLYKK